MCDGMCDSNWEPTLTDEQLRLLGYMLDAERDRRNLTDEQRELLRCMLDTKPTDEQRGLLCYILEPLPTLTDEQRELLDYRLDTGRDTTRDGKLRCESLYKGSAYGDLELMRCTEAAKLRVLITPDMLFPAKYCRYVEGKPYCALVCYGCCPHSDQIEELTKAHERPLEDGTAMNPDLSKRG